MPFIGNQPTQGRFIELDSLTASATDDYTLQLNGANFSPESVNNLLVSINGVIQGSSTMSLNGAVLTVGATLSSSDTIDFVRVFGNVGTVSTPTDGSVTANKIGTGAVTNAKIADGAVAGSKLGTDAILQVKVGGITARFVGTVSAGNYEDVPSLNATITPTSTSSKILVTCSGGIGNTAGGNATLLRLYRGSTNIGNGTGGSNASYRFWTGSLGDETYRLNPFSAQYLDSPSSTSALTYKIQMGAFNATGTIGGRGDDTDYTMPTVLTLMEIGG